MLRGTLTLLIRSLRATARHRKAHAVRILSILLLFGMLIEAHATSGGVGAPGLRLFRSICMLSTALITLAGLGFFVTAITEEKEEGTLALLKLADLSTLSIVLGKSTSRLSTALVTFAGQLPFALLAITLGGLTAHQVWSAFVAMAAYLVLVANLALLCSVVCRRTLTASMMMVFILLVALWLLPLMHESRAVIERHPLVPTGSWVLELFWGTAAFAAENSILFRLQAILDTGFAGSAFSSQVWSSLIAGAVCFVTACLVFDYFTEYSEATPAAVRPQGRRFKVVWRVRRWPLAWKDFHFLAGGPVFVGLKTAFYLVLLVLLFYHVDRFWMYYMSFSEAAWTAALVIGGIESLLCATRIFHAERTERTLSCLLVLPRGNASIAYGKLLGWLASAAPTLLIIGTLAVTTPPPLDWFQAGIEAPLLAAMAFLVLLHLTALYSLIVRWGALPLAIATLLVCGTCVLPPLGAVLAAISAAEQAAGSAGPILYTGLGLSALLQLAIGLRLRTVAAES